MKLEKIGGAGYGSNYSALLSEDLKNNSAVPLFGGGWFTSHIRKAFPKEVDQNKKLETIWYYNVYVNGVPILGFHSTQSFSILDGNKNSSDEELRNIVYATHKQLQSAFETLREEMPILPAVENLSEEDADGVLDQLRQVFGI